MIPQGKPQPLASSLKLAPADDWFAVEQELQSWGATPPLDPEEVPLSRALISIALSLLPELRKLPLSAPKRLLPAADGGIVMEWGDDTDTTVQIWSDGQVELLQFASGRMQSRRQLRPAS